MDDTANFPKFVKYIIILLLILALFVRLPFLRDTLYLPDEGTHLLWFNEDKGALREFIAENDLVYGTSEYYSHYFWNGNEPTQDTHPLLLYKFTNFAYTHLGESVLLTRIVFLLFGFLNIFLIYKLAKKFNSEKIAVFLSAINLFFILFSVFISPYIIVSALTLISTLILMELSKKNSILNLIFLGVIWGVGVSIHYYFIILILTQILILYFLNKNQKRYIAIPFCIASVLFLPSLNLFIRQLMNSSSSVFVKSSLIDIIWSLSLFYLPHAFSVNFMLSNKITFFVAAILFTIYTGLLIKFIFGLRKYSNSIKPIKFFIDLKNRNKRLFILLFSFFGFIFLNMLLALAQIITFSCKYLSIIFPLYIIMISQGLSSIRNKKLKWFILFLIFVLGLVSVWLARELVSVSLARTINSFNRDTIL